MKLVRVSILYFKYSSLDGAGKATTRTGRDSGDGNESLQESNFICKNPQNYILKKVNFTTHKIIAIKLPLKIEKMPIILARNPSNS
jgi:hypothetical protein